MLWLGFSLPGNEALLPAGVFLAYFDRMSVHITLSDELAEQIDHVATDRTAFVSEAVRRLLRDTSTSPLEDEVARINQFADELNREAEDVLEYQVIS
jgi:metal-responsive CopG/Arc/MetJ family transcriptional regulator